MFWSKWSACVVLVGGLSVSLVASNSSESRLPRNPKGLWDELPEAKRLIRERQQVKDHKHDPNSFFTSDYVRPGPSASFPSSQKRQASQAFSSSREDIYGSDYAKSPLTKILLHQELHNGKMDQITKRGSLWKQIEDSHEHQQKLLEVAEKSEPSVSPSGGEDDQTESDDRRRLLVKIAQMVAKKRASDVTDDEIAHPPDGVGEKLEPKVNLDLAQFQRHRADFLQNSKPVFKISDPQEELDLRTHKLNGLTMRVLERAKLRKKPQYQSSGLAVTSGQFDNRFHDDKIPTLDTSKFLKRTGDAGRRMDNTENPEESISADGNRLVSQIKALTVFDKIKEMQREIKELNEEIQEENRRIENAENELAVIDNSKEENQLDKQEKMTMLETVREIKLKKEDAKMKAIETQIKLKRLQDKDRVGRDDPDLEAALQMVAARRKLIQEALVQQRQRTLERQRLAALALESKKSLDAERLRLAGEIQQEERNRILRQRAEKERELTAALESSSKLLEKARNRVAHKKLAEASNQRVITKIQSLALKKRQEAVRQRNILAKAQLAKLTSTLPVRSQLQKLRINEEASKPVSRSPLTRIRPSSPLLRLTPKELTEVLSFLDLQKNADILAKTNEKVVAKAKANNAAEALILDAAKQALGEDSLSLTDSEVDDLLGVNEIIPVDPVLDLGLGGGIDILGLDYPDPLDDYNVDLEDILIDYEYEFDTPILPTGPVGIPGPIGVTGPGISLTPKNVHPPPHAPHGYYSKPKPLAKPHKSHSYQYFQQVNSHHHPKPVNHYHEPEAYHDKKPEPYHHHHPPPPEPYHPPPNPKPYYPPPKPEPYYAPPPKEHHKDEHYHKHEVHDHYKDPYKDYEVHHLHEDYHPSPPKKEHYHHHHEHLPHKAKHYPEPEYYPPPHKEEHHHHKPEYYKPDPYHEPEYDYHDPEPYHEPEYDYHEAEEIYHPPPPKKHYTRPAHHHDDHEYDEHYEEDYIPHGYKTHDPYIDKDYHRKPKHHHQDYDDPYYEPSSPSFSVGPYHAPPKQTGAEFLSSVSPLLDVAAAGLGNQGQISGLLRHSLLRDIQDKVDTELHLGPGGQHTRVTIGRLPPDPPRLTPPFRSRSSDNSRSRRQIKSSSREHPRKKDVVTQHKPSSSVTFSDLMSDFLSKDPLPIHEKQRKSRNV